MDIEIQNIRMVGGIPKSGTPSKSENSASESAFRLSEEPVEYCIGDGEKTITQAHAKAIADSVAKNK